MSIENMCSTVVVRDFWSCRSCLRIDLSARIGVYTIGVLSLYRTLSGNGRFDLSMVIVSSSYLCSLTLTLPIDWFLSGRESIKDELLFEQYLDTTRCSG